MIVLCVICDNVVVCCLFSDAASNSLHKLMVNDKLERMWNVPVMSLCEVCSGIFLVEMQKTMKDMRIVRYCGWDSNQPTSQCDAKESHLSPLAQSVGDTLSVVWEFWLCGVAGYGRKFLQ